MPSSFKRAFLSDIVAASARSRIEAAVLPIPTHHRKHQHVIAIGGNRRPWCAWLLLVLPPLVCYSIMNVVRIVPPGRSWALIELLLVSIVPLSVSVACTILIAQLLSKRSKMLQVVLCCIELPVIFFVWQQTCQMLVTSWR